jgi:glycogen synthase
MDETDAKNPTGGVRLTATGLTSHDSINSNRKAAMRILFWSSDFLPPIGGIGVLAGQLLPAMRKRGFEYIVVTSRGDRNLPPSTTFEGIPVHRFTFWQSIVDIDALTQVKQQVANLKRLFAPDLIHINGVGRNEFFQLVTATSHPAPVLVTLHGEWVPQADAIAKSTLQSAAWVVGCSNAILDKGRRLAPEIVSRSSVIYNAVAETSALPAPLPTQPQRVLCLGRLSEEKGFDVGLAAFASIVERFPHARLIIAGDGPERTKLVRQASELHLNDAVEFVGWVAPKDVPALINTATVVLTPSRVESLPLVALEAAMLGRPVIGTRVGGLPEVVLHQQTGLLVGKEDVQGLARAITSLLEQPETAARMGRTARLRAQQAFSWNQHVDSYDALYQRMANNWQKRNQNGRAVQLTTY